MKLTPKQTAMLGRTIELKWTTSRGRDTYGYTICSLFEGSHKQTSCNGGGYDMRGTVVGNWITRTFREELLRLKPEDMPAQSHWERSNPPSRICRDRECVMRRIAADQMSESVWRLPPTAMECPQCGNPTCEDHQDGKIVQDGHSFYGLTYHDPNYDPGKAVVGEDCTDRTLGTGSTGQTVEEAEKAGKSFGLERLQACYKASSKVPTKRHTEPSIDGACGFSEVRKILNAIGLDLRMITDTKNTEIYEITKYKEAKSL